MAAVTLTARLAGITITATTQALTALIFTGTGTGIAAVVQPV